MKSRQNVQFTPKRPQEILPITFIHVIPHPHITNAVDTYKGHRENVTSAEFEPRSNAHRSVREIRHALYTDVQRKQSATVPTAAAGDEILAHAVIVIQHSNDRCR